MSHQEQVRNLTMHRSKTLKFFHDIFDVDYVKTIKYDVHKRKFTLTRKYGSCRYFYCIQKKSTNSYVNINGNTVIYKHLIKQLDVVLDKISYEPYATTYITTVI